MSDEESSGFTYAKEKGNGPYTEFEDIDYQLMDIFDNLNRITRDMDFSREKTDDLNKNIEDLKELVLELNDAFVINLENYNKLNENEQRGARNSFDPTNFTNTRMVEDILEGILKIRRLLKKLPVMNEEEFMDFIKDEDAYSKSMGKITKVIEFMTPPREKIDELSGIVSIFSSRYISRLYKIVKAFDNARIKFNLSVFDKANQLAPPPTMRKDPEDEEDVMEEFRKHLQATRTQQKGALETVLGPISNQLDLEFSESTSQTDDMVFEAAEEVESDADKRNSLYARLLSECSDLFTTVSVAKLQMVADQMRQVV